MADNILPRIGGSASIVATILLAIGFSLHPSALSWGTVGTRQFFINAINAINSFDLWVPIHSILLAFPILLSLTVAALYKTFRARGEETFSMMALVAVILVAPVLIVGFVIDGFAYPALARAYASAVNEASREAILIAVQSAASIELPINTLISPLLVWSTFGFIGVAVIRTRVFPRWVGYLGIALGVAMWLDWPAAILFIPAFPSPIILAGLTGQLFPTFFWLIAVGAYMLRLR